MKVARDDCPQIAVTVLRRGRRQGLLLYEVWEVAIKVMNEPVLRTMVISTESYMG
jgi:hypothetical protein